MELLQLCLTDWRFQHHSTQYVLDAKKDYVGAASIVVQIVPIASLNAYQNRWTIKAKVSVRSDMRRWSNAKGEGKFFTVDLLDGQDGEIRAIAFNDQADQFYDLLEPGRVFTISKASLKPKKPGSVSTHPFLSMCNGNSFAIRCFPLPYAAFLCLGPHRQSSGPCIHLPVHCVIASQNAKHNSENIGGQLESQATALLRRRAIQSSN